MDGNPFNHSMLQSPGVARDANPVDYFTMITDWLDGARQAALDKISCLFDVQAPCFNAHQREVVFQPGST